MMVRSRFASLSGLSVCSLWSTYPHHYARSEAAQPGFLGGCIKCNMICPDFVQTIYFNSELLADFGDRMHCTLLPEWAARPEGMVISCRFVCKSRVLAGPGPWQLIHSAGIVLQDTLYPLAWNEHYKPLYGSPEDFFACHPETFFRRADG